MRQLPPEAGIVTWTVAYYCGELPLVFRGSDTWRWKDLPQGDGVTTGVAWVDVLDSGYRHRLLGKDCYWLDEASGSFGLFNDPANCAWYGGGPDAQQSAWRWTGVGSECIDPQPPASAHVLLGVMLPEEHARAVGLLGPNDAQPVRPN